MRILISIISLLVIFTALSNAQQATNNNVTKLYIATFDRAPDTQGLSYWVNSALSLEEIASSFFEQIETMALYPDGYSNIDFILAIYKNIFAREPDQEGLGYWLDRLDSGDISRPLFILAVVNGAKGDDVTLLDNKTEVGEEFIKSGSNDTLIAKNIMQNITTSRQTITDAFKEINNINVSGTGHTVIGGDYISGKGHTVTGDTTIINNITNVYQNGEIVDTQTTEDNSDSQPVPIEPEPWPIEEDYPVFEEENTVTPPVTNEVFALIERNNQIRNELYQGSNLSWSNSIASLTQEHANYLGQNGIIEHDPSNYLYGENIAVANYPINYTDAINMWYEEKSLYNYSTNSCYSGEICGHYTQLIWKDTTEVGCAKAIVQAGKFEGGTVVVCRYNPSGNWVNELPY